VEGKSRLYKTRGAALTTTGETGTDRGGPANGCGGVVAAGKPLCRTDSAAAVRLWRPCRVSWWGTAAAVCGATT